MSIKVTVAVCTLNREAVLRQTLEDVWDQKYEPLELLVVDQTDQLTAEMEAFYKDNAHRLRLIRMEAKGQGQARNRAANEATGEIIIYFDDDVRLFAGLIEHHIKHFTDQKVGAVVGRVDDNNGDPPSCGGRVNWYGRVKVERDISAIHPVESLSGGNMAIRTDLLKKIGGFWELKDNTVQMREETDASLAIIKAGYLVICEPEARLLHLAHKSGGSRQNQDRIRWYEDYFFAEFSYFFRNFPKWKLPFYLLSLSRPILACSFYYGKGRLVALSAPWKGLKRAWR